MRRHAAYKWHMLRVNLTIDDSPHSLILHECVVGSWKSSTWSEGKEISLIAAVYSNSAATGSLSHICHSLTTSFINAPSMYGQALSTHGQFPIYYDEQANLYCKRIQVWCFIWNVSLFTLALFMQLFLFNANEWLPQVEYVNMNRPCQCALPLSVATVVWAKLF